MVLRDNDYCKKPQAEFQDVVCAPVSLAACRVYFAVVPVGGISVPYLNVWGKKSVGN